ncbi:MAG: outer membrane biogenesis lipoprotein LolB [Urechidicola sp.]|jgi:hypothetical protein|tara:strand:- start:12 stop:143 length:132 start_codon:yes stop_codon:yes gene_type:complete
MKKERLIKLFFAAALIVACSSCVTKKKKKCNTCPTWGGVQTEL